MKKIIFIVVSVLMFISCNKEKKTLVYGYSVLKEKFQTYTLNIVETDSVTEYKYYHKKHKEGNLFLKFKKKENIITADFGVFSMIDKSFVYKNLKFYFYRVTKKGSRPATILFHKDYGLLASSTTGASFVFLKEQLSKEKNNMLFNEMKAVVNPSKKK